VSKSNVELGLSVRELAAAFRRYARREITHEQLVEIVDARLAANAAKKKVAA